MFYNCPHCNGLIEITKINCGIFRHGYYKKTGRQISPHAKKITIKKHLENNNIIGCGKPFKLNKNNEIEICDYI